MKFPEISCAEVKEQLVFYSYGEVSSAMEEQVEAHLETCAECRAERARHAAFLEAVDELDRTVAIRRKFPN